MAGASRICEDPGVVLHRWTSRVGREPRVMRTWPAALLSLVLGCDRAQPETKAEPSAQPAPSVGLVKELEQARRETMCVDAKLIAQAAELHMVQQGGTCPTSVEELVRTKVLARVPESASSWAIACSEAEVIVSAPGADGQLGTPDDVVQGGPPANCTP